MNTTFGLVFKVLIEPTTSNLPAGKSSKLQIAVPVRIHSSDLIGFNNGLRTYSYEVSEKERSLKESCGSDLPGLMRYARIAAGVNSPTKHKCAAWGGLSQCCCLTQFEMKR